MSEQHRWYFRKQATLNGAPNVPAGCFTLSRDVPTMTDANGGGGGHMSTSTGAASAQLNKPQAQDNTSVAGEAPQTSPPIAAHQFGWFSDLKLTGRYDSGAWGLVLREDDNNAGITSHWTCCLYANTTRDFSSSMRFVADLHGAIDNWTGTLTVQTQSLAGEEQFVLNGEYLFFQLWCHETAAFAAGNTMTIHQEGSDLTDAQRSNLLSPYFKEFLPDYSNFPPVRP